MLEGKFQIKGGNPLRGEVQIRGSKNAASKMMVASLLTESPCMIENVPVSGEIEITKELCERIGSRVLSASDHELHIETPEIKEPRVPGLSRKNRVPILALGPLLHRRGVAEVPVLGGCPIGHRPINFHLEALNKMGARIERRESSYYAETDGLRGADIEFPWSSVGATENVMLAAVLARGTTRIKNAALEPEVLNMVEMLNGMGARITCDAAERTMEVKGVKELGPARVRVIPDRNEAASFASAALATRGEVFLRGADASHLGAFLEKVREAGGQAEIAPRGVFFRGGEKYRAVSIETLPHPGFMTDWQQPFAVLLTQASGESIIHETIYEDRFGYIKDLNRMGANISVSDECAGSNCRLGGQTFNHTARINGPTALHGLELVMTDIRAGMAHIIAALVAEGESVIFGVEHVDRGYEKIEERLRVLGADIKRV